MPLARSFRMDYQLQLAELGDALMNFVEGPHCTLLDPHTDGDPDAIRSKARSLVARFEKLGRSKDMLMVAVSLHHRMTCPEGVSLTFGANPCMEK